MSEFFIKNFKFSSLSFTISIHYFVEIYQLFNKKQRIEGSKSQNQKHKQFQL